MGAKKVMTFSVEMIEEPRSRSKATSPRTTGSRSATSARSTGSEARAMSSPSWQTADADGGKATAGRPAATRESITRRVSRLAADQTEANPRHSSIVFAPAWVPKRAAT